MKKYYNTLYVTFFFLCANVAMFAQPGSGNGTNDLETPDIAAPIDDYILILALVGLVFVFMKFNSFSRQKN